MKSIVLDSSAVLAMILCEPGGERVRALINPSTRDPDLNIAISTVNWCEALTRVRRDFFAMTTDKLRAALPQVEMVPFDSEQAERAAEYSDLDRSLSLGDRACLSLAESRGAKAWTADRVWAQNAAQFNIEVIR